MSDQTPSDPDPWKKKGRQDPPFLDDLLRDWLKSWNRFAQHKTMRGAGPSGRQSFPPAWKQLLSLGLLAFFVLYGITGIYIVDPAEEAVIQRFGRYERTVGPGPHWYPRGIEKKTIVNVKEVHTNQHAGLMLTRDENIVEVEIAVQYTKDNPRYYLFNIYQPEETLKQVADSALRYVIGHSTLDEVLTSGRSEIAFKIQEQVVRNLADYNSGIEISDVVMQPARAPREVKDAFDDVIRAQEDEFRLMNQADAYAKRIQPIAEGQAQRLAEEAEAYQKKVVALAKGETQRFNALLPPYQAAPAVLKQRLYLNMMAEVLGQSTKIIADNDLGNALMVLPMEKIMAGSDVLSKALAKTDSLSPLAESSAAPVAPAVAPAMETEELHRSSRPMRRPVREEGE